MSLCAVGRNHALPSGVQVQAQIETSFDETWEKEQAREERARLRGPGFCSASTTSFPDSSIYPCPLDQSHAEQLAGA